MSDSVTSGKNKEIINQIKTLLTDPDFAQNKKDAIKNADKTLLRSFSKELEKLEDMGKYETKNEKDLKVRKSYNEIKDQFEIIQANKIITEKQKIMDLRNIKFKIEEQIKFYEYKLPDSSRLKPFLAAFYYN